MDVLLSIFVVAHNNECWRSPDTPTKALQPK